MSSPHPVLFVCSRRRITAVVVFFSCLVSSDPLSVFCMHSPWTYGLFSGFVLVFSCLFSSFPAFLLPASLFITFWIIGLWFSAFIKARFLLRASRPPCLYLGPVFVNLAAAAALATPRCCSTHLRIFMCVALPDQMFM